MKALIIRKPGEAAIEEVAEPKLDPEDVLLRVRMVGLCGSDLNSYRGRNSMMRFPRIPGHEIAATIVEGNCSSSGLVPGTAVTISPYTNCGKCASCLRSRPNACACNETLGVQRNGALTEYITMPPEKLYAAALTIKELCLVEPLTVGFHAVSRGRVDSTDTVAVIGCGGVGLGAVAASRYAGAKTIAIDVVDQKLEIARKAGAAHILNSSKDSLHQRLLDLTDGRGPDVIIEAVGHPQTFRAAVEEVAFTGRVVYIGYTKEPVAYETRARSPERTRYSWFAECSARGFSKGDQDARGKTISCRRCGRLDRVPRRSARYPGDVEQESVEVYQNHGAS